MKNDNSTYSKQIGKTTFIVCVKQAETAQKPLEIAFCDLCRHEVQGGYFGGEKYSLDKLRKTS